MYNFYFGIVCRAYLVVKTLYQCQFREVQTFATLENDILLPFLQTILYRTHAFLNPLSIFYF